MPAEVARPPLLLTDAKHVRDERAGAAPSPDSESEPAVGVESQLFPIGDEDRAPGVGENSQNIDRDQLLRWHAPDSRLEANQKSQRVERLPGAVNEVIAGALGMLPAEGREDDVTEPGNGLPPAVAVPTQPEPLRMERSHGKLDLGPLAGVSRPLQGNHLVWHRAGILTAVRMWL